MSKPAQKLVRFDWAMKNILRDKANFDVLEGFLTSLLKEKITIEELLESESNQDGPDHKLNRVDLKCKDSSGRQIIVEVQSQPQEDYFERIVWGVSKALVESVKRGKKYLNIAKVISVSIIFYEIPFADQNDDYLYYGKTDLIGCHSQKPLRVQHGVTEKNVTSGDIFPEYYVICVENFGNVVKDLIDEWVYVFKNETVGDNFHAPGIEAAEAKLDYLGMSAAERAKYDADRNYASHVTSILSTAVDRGIRKGEKLGLKKGEKLGLEKGEKLGLEKGEKLGLKIGLEKGRTEGETIGIEKEKLEIARNMKAEGFDTAIIVKMTGLSPNEVEQIK